MWKRIFRGKLFDYNYELKKDEENRFLVEIEGEEGVVLQVYKALEIRGHYESFIQNTEEYEAKILIKEGKQEKKYIFIPSKPRLKSGLKEIDLMLDEIREKEKTLKKLASNFDSSLVEIEDEEEILSEILLPFVVAPESKIEEREIKIRKELGEEIELGIKDRKTYMEKLAFFDFVVVRGRGKKRKFIQTILEGLSLNSIPCLILSEDAKSFSVMGRGNEKNKEGFGFPVQEVNLKINLEMVSGESLLRCVGAQSYKDFEVLFEKNKETIKKLEDLIGRERGKKDFEKKRLRRVVFLVQDVFGIESFGINRLGEIDRVTKRLGNITLAKTNEEKKGIILESILNELRKAKKEVFVFVEDADNITDFIKKDFRKVILEFDETPSLKQKPTLEAVVYGNEVVIKAKNKRSVKVTIREPYSKEVE